METTSPKIKELADVIQTYRVGDRDRANLMRKGETVKVKTNPRRAE